jgi:hypothetical protein
MSASTLADGVAVTQIEGTGAFPVSASRGV